MERREFLSWVGVGFVASSLPVAIAACSSTSSTGGSNTATSQSSTRADGFVPVGTVAQLDSAGFVQDEKSAVGNVAVVRDPNKPDAVLAVEPVCTHAGCPVDWKKDQKAFSCGCHGSAFGPDGKVQRAPATKPLKTYQAKIEGDTVLVKA